MRSLGRFLVLSKKVLDAYTHAPLKDKAFFCLRMVTAAFFDLETYVPKKGKILDLGCGHGIFSVILVLTSKLRRVVGIDLDFKKIAVAEPLQATHSRLAFFPESLTAHQKRLVSEKVSKMYGCITIVDVTYLLPEKATVDLLKNCKKILTKKATLILKTSQKEQSLGHSLAVLQEKIMVQLLQKTKTQHAALHFKTIQEYRALFAKAGFAIKQEKRLKTLFFHPHYVFVLTPTAFIHQK